MKVTEKQKKFVRIIIQKWRPILYLHKWDFKTKYHSEDDNEGVAARVNHSPNYFEAEINVYPLFWVEEDENVREMILVHELVHTIIGPLDHDFQQLHKGKHVDLNSHAGTVERVTQHITNILIYNGDWHKKRK